MSVLELENVNTYYDQSHVLQDLSLSVEEGETVALLGRNGVGKTTTLRTILQLTPPRSGSVRLEGEEVTGMATHEIARRGVGWVPEDRRMFDHLTVVENVRAALPRGADEAERLPEVFEWFPDLEELAEKDAGNLSGGQQQMLAIARALVGDNDVLLIDEPSEGLAPLIVEEVVEALSALADDQTLVLVEQNVPMALELSDRYYVIDHGSVVAEGASADADLEDETFRRYLTA